VAVGAVETGLAAEDASLDFPDKLPSEAVLAGSEGSCNAMLLPNPVTLLLKFLVLCPESAQLSSLLNPSQNRFDLQQDVKIPESFGPLRVRCEVIPHKRERLQDPFRMVDENSGRHQSYQNRKCDGESG
jgi:hypothetical protein